MCWLQECDHYNTILTLYYSVLIPVTLEIIISEYACEVLKICGANRAFSGCSTDISIYLVIPISCYMLKCKYVNVL